MSQMHSSQQQQSNPNAGPPALPAQRLRCLYPHGQLLQKQILGRPRELHALCQRQHQLLREALTAQLPYVAQPPLQHRHPKRAKQGNPPQPLCQTPRLGADSPPEGMLRSQQGSHQF